MVWDPQQYLVFKGPRLQPAIDLLARIPLEAPQTVVDLGCGPGNVTPLLKQRWPNAKVIGLDNSDEMLDLAQSAVPEVKFEKVDVSNWDPNQKFDIIFSNAALQWVTGHEILFRKIAANVAPGAS